MAKKIYKYPIANAFFILPNGDSIQFKKKEWGENFSCYKTSDKAEQELIENLPEYKRGFITIYDEEVETEPIADEIQSTPTNSPIEIYTEVTKTQQAIDIIKETCAKRGIPYKTIRSKDVAIAMANTLSLSFPNL